MITLDLEIVPPPAPVDNGCLRKVHTLRDLWGTWIKLRGELSPDYLQQYYSLGDRFCSFMEGNPLGPTSLVAWVQHLQSGTKTTLKGTSRAMGASTINATNLKVKGFLRWLKIMNLVQLDLDKCIPRVHEPEGPKEVEIFTAEEYERIKAYCASRSCFQTHLWLITLGYRTGMALKDCCYLRWKDVHIDPNGHSYIDIYRIKTKRLGVKALCRIPLLPYSDLWNWLEKLKLQVPYKRFDGIPDYVHRDAPGLYECNFSNVAQDFKNICLRAGVRGIGFHSLRRSFCSMLVNSNTNLALVMAMTGHNSVNMLLRYLQPDRRALQEAMERAVKTLEKPNEKTT